MKQEKNISHDSVEHSQSREPLSGKENAEKNQICDLPSDDEQSEIQKAKERTRRKLILFLLLLILLLLLLSACCVSVTMWALFFKEPVVTLRPDYAPREPEENQIPLKDDETDTKMETEEGGGAVSLNYSDFVTIDLSDKNAVLRFSNPSKSTRDILIQIVIRDEIVAQSGRLTPGNKVTVLHLLSGAEKKLSVGGYDGKFILSYYDPDTGEKSVVNTEIPVSISVVE